MYLSELLKPYIHLPIELDRQIDRLTLDSRLVKKNDLFIALIGHQLDGKQYIVEAITKGACAVLCEGTSTTSTLTFHQDIPIISVNQLAMQLGQLAAYFYDRPAEHLRIIGVTGTSGKTSCTHFIAQALHYLQIPCGIIGTLGAGLFGALQDKNLTTPDVLTIQSLLSDFRGQSINTVAMEASSHGINQGRIKGIAFETGIFTNLSQDHLDYHGSLEAYAAVKYRFFTDYPMRYRIFNLDDTYGKKWAVALSKSTQIFAYSTQGMVLPRADMALIYADKIQLTAAGIKAKIHTPWGKGELFCPLIGQFNLGNVLAALTALCLQGHAFDKVLASMTFLQSVPGRMQLLKYDNKPLVVVDYAHKPDALEKVLIALRAHTKGKLICVFGCGGNRDALKRPLMAAIAERLADQIIVTNDNPRHESPISIVEDILRGFKQSSLALVELDRSKAIEKSIQWATSDDCILIAGKGAEQYQQIGDQKFLFDDVTVALSYLA